MVDVRWDSSDPEQLREALKLAEQEKQAVLQGTDDYVMAQDKTGKVLWANSRVAELLGTSPQALKGRYCFEVLQGRDSSCPGCPREETLQTGRPATCGASHPGGKTWLERCYPIWGPEGDIQGVVTVARDLTGQKRLEQTVRETNESLQMVFRASPAAIIAVAADGTVRSWNPAAERIFGWSENEVVGRLLPFVSEEKREEAQALRERLLRGELLTNVEALRARKDGSPVWVSMSAAPLPDAHGLTVGMMAICQDITEHKRAEAELAKLSEAVRQTADSVVVTDRDGVIEYVNPAFERHSGYSREEAIGKTPRILKSGLLSEEFYKEMWATILAGKPFHDVLVNRKKNGELVHELKTITPMMDAAGHIPHFVAIGTDITERIQAQEQLRCSEALYRSVVSLVDIAVVRCDTEGRRTFANDALVRRYGTTVEELLGKPFTDHLDPEDAERARRLFAQCLESLTPIKHSVFRHARDGKHHYSLVDFTPLFGADGQATGVQVTSMDVTNLIESDQRLRQSEELYRSLVDAGPAVIRSTRDGKRTFASQKAAALFGASQEALLAGTFRDTILPEDMGKVEAAFQEVFERGRSVSGLVVRHRIAGEVRHISTNWEPVRDAQGNVAEAQNTALDITDERRLEEQYLQAQKMESVGRLAGGVAHDFNNLLTVILGYAEMCADMLPRESPLREHVREIQTAGERAASLTRQLLAFSRRQIVKPRVIDLNELVANMQKMLGRLIGEDVQLVTMTRPDLWPVLVDPGQLEQVLANLAVNARDAMPQGGKLTIETANVTLDESYASTHAEVTPGDYVMLSVSDTGVGMTEEVKAHLFEPFFTTKGVGQGTGLGLATCYGIVKQAGGHIWVYSEPGQGTSFRAYLPRVHAGTEGLGELEPVEVLQGTETVLVAEDEPAVRAVAATVLRSQGYTVLEASGGAQALRVAEEHAGPIHLLLTDVVMPEMSGRVLAQQLAAQRPDMKVLYTSGYTANAVVHHGVLDEGTHFLQKPFSMGGLARKVRQVLDEGEEQP